MRNNIYNEEALKKLNSPERLNEMIKVTSAKTWLALTGLIIIFVALGVWSVVGNIPRKIQGRGIIIQAGGITEISSLAMGKIKDIPFKEGDLVNANDIIAYIAQPELELQINNSTNKLNELKKRYSSMSSYNQKDMSMMRELLLTKQSIQEQTIQANEERLVFLGEQIQAQEELLISGLITRETLNNTKTMFFQVIQENEKLKNELKAINLELLEMTKKNEVSLNTIESSILELEAQIDELKAKYEISTQIRSPYYGRVVEIMVNPGEVLSMGHPVISLEVLGLEDKLEAIIYVSPSQGKKVEKGMRVNVSPSTVAKEEFGYIEGVVQKVSEFPSSKEGMIRILGNSTLVESFAAGEPPIAIYVQLLKSADTYSGYKWTSAKGPETKVKSGTLCDAAINIETHRPISLLFPSIKIKK